MAIFGKFRPGQAMRLALARDFPDDRIARARELLPIRPVADRPAGQPLRIAIQCVDDPFYYALFRSLLLSLRSRADVRAELILIRSVNAILGRGLLQSLFRSVPMALLVGRHWTRAYADLSPSVAYRSRDLRHPLGDAVDLLRSWRLWRRLRREADISDLSIHGTVVGDLLVDSYLRLRPSAHFTAADPFLIRLLWQVHRDLRRARRYFRERRPHVYLTSYSTYIEHGVAARVALREGVSVRSFGNFVQIGKPLTAADPYHTANCDSYRSGFEALEDPANALAAADRQLQIRFSGGIDPATSYMRASAYSAGSETIDAARNAVVVFLHDFFDSPHVYPDLIFPDFWAWITFTIETLQRLGIRFLVKPHPNQIGASRAVLDELLERFPRLPLLETKVSNASLAGSGMLCGVTVYGTVAHELAYFGIPTIACARHPHHTFDFCRTARSVDEYARMLSTPSAIPLAAEEMKRQSLAFYFMHNLHGTGSELALRSCFVAFWQACNLNDGNTAFESTLVKLRDALWSTELPIDIVGGAGTAPASRSR
jgi:hypothetical protein